MIKLSEAIKEISLLCIMDLWKMSGNDVDRDDMGIALSRALIDTGYRLCKIESPDTNRPKGARSRT